MLRVLIRVAAAVAVVVALGCGDDQPFPIGPTSTSSGTSGSQAIARPESLRGAVSNLTGTCPTVTFTVRSTSISTTANTVFPVGACTDLANSDVVTLEGTPQSDGSLVATSVDVPRPLPPPPTRVRGTVSSLAGSCPALTFMVGTTAISTTASTVFSEGRCSNLSNGAVVVVEGASQSDGSIVADRVSTVVSGNAGS